MGLSSALISVSPENKAENQLYALAGSKGRSNMERWNSVITSKYFLATNHHTCPNASPWQQKEKQLSELWRNRRKEIGHEMGHWARLRRFLSWDNFNEDIPKKPTYAGYWEGKAQNSGEKFFLISVSLQHSEHQVKSKQLVLLFNYLKPDLAILRAKLLFSSTHLMPFSGTHNARMPGDPDQKQINQGMLLQGHLWAWKWSIKLL